METKDLRNKLTEEQKDFLKKCLFISKGSINYSINALGILNSNKNKENYNIEFFCKLMRAKYKTFEIFKEREFYPNLVERNLDKSKVVKIINSIEGDFDTKTAFEKVLSIYNYTLDDLKTKIVFNNDIKDSEEIIEFVHKMINESVLLNGTKVTDDRYTNKLLNYLEGIYETIDPITMEEAFLINCKSTQVLAFDCINPVEFFKYSKTKKRISVDGKEMNYYRFAEKDGWYSKDGDFSESEKEGYTFTKKYDRYSFVKHNIYEVYSIDVSELSDEVESGELAYAVRCWCTSTNEEAWIWIDKYREPLDAIASVHKIDRKVYNEVKNLISKGKEVLFKRQGDTLYIENDELPLYNSKEDDLISLTKEEYFNMLICET